MSGNPIAELNRLYFEFSTGTIDRRQFILRAAGLGLSAAALVRFLSCIPVYAAQLQTPLNRKQWQSELAKAFPFTKNPDASKTGGLLTYGRIADSVITTTNLLLASDSSTQSIMNLVQEYLVGVSPLDGQFVPGLADSWEIGDDGKTYTFHLNPKAHWHDRKAFSADDVIFSFDAQASEELGTQFQASFSNAVDSYRKIDDNSVELIAKDVFAPVVFLGNSLTPIMPKHIWESIKLADWARDPASTGVDLKRVVGTGPFKVAEVAIGGTSIRLAANSDYYDSPPVISNVVFKAIPDGANAVKALRSGDVDVLERLPPDNIHQLENDNNFEISVYDTYSFIWYGYNLDPEKTKLFQDLEVRKALLLGLDRKTMVKNVMRGFAEVADGTQPLLSTAYDPDEIHSKYSYDPKQAATLLDDAAWSISDGNIRKKDDTSLSFEVLYDKGSPQIREAVGLMRSDWRKIGVDARPKAVDLRSELIPALTETFDFEMVALGFTWDATGDQSPMFGSEFKGVGFNAVGYSNPKYDELADEANREIDPEKRRQLLIEASNIVNDDLPIGILWFRRDGTVSRTGVHNFVPNGRSALWSLRWTWIE